MLEHHVVLGNPLELGFGLTLKVAGTHEPRLEVAVMRRERLDTFVRPLRRVELRFEVAYFALECAEFRALVFLQCDGFLHPRELMQFVDVPRLFVLEVGNMFF